MLAGFTVATLAYAEFMNTSGLERALNEIVSAIDYRDTTGLEAQTNRIRTMMLDTEFPFVIAAAITQAYRELGGTLPTDTQNLCAVRSSGLHIA